MDPWVHGTVQATTSGTTKDFTVPSGITKFTLMGKGVSLSGTDELLVRLGYSGGVDASGYVSRWGYIDNAASTSVSSTSGSFPIKMAAAAATMNFKVEGVLMDPSNNIWLMSVMGGKDDVTDELYLGSSICTLSGELTTVRLLPNGSDTFDAGSVNIVYDNPNLAGGDVVYITGGVVQTVNAQDGEVATGTTVAPFDDTVMQNTEGTEFITASITPKSASNKLRIDVVMQASNSTAPTGVIAGLFQDSTADSLRTIWISQTNVGYSHFIAMTHWMDAGTTSSTTFKLRAGPSSGGTLTVNGAATARRFGGKLPLSITITEYAA